MVDVSPEAFSIYSGLDIAVRCHSDEQFLALAEMERRKLGNFGAVNQVQTILKMMHGGGASGKPPYCLRYYVDGTGRPKRVSWCDEKYYREEGMTVVDFQELVSDYQSVILPDVTGLLGGL